MTPQFDHYQTEGRTLYCEFKCRRCGATYMRPLKECVPNDEGDRWLRNTVPPPGWDTYYGGLLCAECADKLRRFIAGEELAHKRPVEIY